MIQMVDQQRVLTEPNTYWKKKTEKESREREKCFALRSKIWWSLLCTTITQQWLVNFVALFKQKAAPNEINIIVVYFVSCPRALAVAAFKKRHSPQRKNATLYINMGLKQKHSGRKAIACHYSFDGNQKRVFIDFAMIILLRQYRSWLLPPSNHKIHTE